MIKMKLDILIKQGRIFKLYFSELYQLLIVETSIRIFETLKWSLNQKRLGNTDISLPRLLSLFRSYIISLCVLYFNVSSNKFYYYFINICYIIIILSVRFNKDYYFLFHQYCVSLTIIKMYMFDKKRETIIFIGIIQYLMEFNFIIL